jgi:hypothetical protein
VRESEFPPLTFGVPSKSGSEEMKVAQKMIVERLSSINERNSFIVKSLSTISERNSFIEEIRESTRERGEFHGGF